MTFLLESEKEREREGGEEGLKEEEREGGKEIKVFKYFAIKQVTQYERTIDIITSSIGYKPVILGVVGPTTKKPVHR